MTTPHQKEVSQLLRDWRGGNKAALDSLMPIVYDELRRLASGFLRRERSDHTLQTTALVHEAYIHLVDQDQTDWQNRTHFFGAAAQLMRRILVDHARAHRAAKRGGGALKVTLNEVAVDPTGQDIDVIALDEALNELAALDSQQSRLVELRYFSGLSIEETAEVMGISPATVKRQWNSARAWLHRRMTVGTGQSEK
ncbi:MAG: sigma-70 family RNA polymerase sigma factor [Blastocatellia bacterium]|nr:sigma-70 family RNA polymerase sigma factor [Blastocatellia bacterium]